jgi:hypothetical protein
MTTLTKPPKSRKVRCLKPIALKLDGFDYDAETGQGTASFNGKVYLLEVVKDGPRTTGLAFGPLDGTDTTHHIDFTCEYGWRCDCPDAIYNSDRAGGCKHLNAARLMAAALRQGGAR